MSDASDDDRDDEKFALHGVYYSGSGHKRCVVCRRETFAGMMTMPKETRLDLLISHSMHAPDDVRCCNDHLLAGKRLRPADIWMVINHRWMTTTALFTEEMMETITDLLLLILTARDGLSA